MRKLPGYGLDWYGGGEVEVGFRGCHLGVDGCPDGGLWVCFWLGLVLLCLL